MVVCNLGIFERKRLRPPVKKAKILTLEEWMRINNHLSLPMKTVKEKEVKEEEEEEDIESEKIQISSSHIPNVDKNGIDSGKFKYDMKGNKEEIIQKAKCILFENKDYVRRIRHGLKLSSVLHERNGQINFNRRIERERRITEKETAEKLNKEITNYREELKVRALKETEKMKRFKNELDKQISEKIDKLKEDRSEKEKEKNYFIKISRECDAMREEERSDRLRKKQKFKEDFIRCWKAQNEIRRLSKAKDLEQEEIDKIYRDIASEINAKRKNKENSRFKIKYNSNGRTLVEYPSVEYTESKIGKGIRKVPERHLKKKALIEDLLKTREMYEEQAEKERQNYEIERKISAVRRREKAEADEIRKQKERRERLETIYNTGKYYSIQCKEKEEEKKREKELDLFYVPDFNPESELINNYCKEIISLVDKVKRPLFPVLAAVNEIKKEFGLERKRNTKFLKSNVPIGN